MPQFNRKPGQTRNHTAVRAETLASVRRGSDVGEQHVSVRSMIQRLGKDEIKQAAVAAGRKPPSDRSLRRWAKQDRIPHAEVAERVKRADHVQRMGGDAEAARRAGRSVKTIKKWKSDPEHEMKPDATEKVERNDLADRRTAAGIPNVNGTITKPAFLHASGDVWVKGTGSSPTYEATRTVSGKQLDMDTTLKLVEAREAGDDAAALAAVEDFLSTNHAQCEGYGDEFGWHWENLSSWDISW